MTAAGVLKFRCVRRLGASPGAVDPTATRPAGSIDRAATSPASRTGRTALRQAFRAAGVGDPAPPSSRRPVEVMVMLEELPTLEQDGSR